MVAGATGAGQGSRWSRALGSLLVLAGCRQEHVIADARAPRCAAITDISGAYRCSGECIVTEDAQRKVLPVPEETDTVQRYPGASAELYQVEIAPPGFSELEIGALVGDTLRTATAAVTGDQYPVLEKYVRGRCLLPGARVLEDRAQPQQRRLQELPDPLPEKRVSAVARAG